MGERLAKDLDMGSRRYAKVDGNWGWKLEENGDIRKKKNDTTRGDIRSIARLTCSANTILLSCLKNPLTGLSSGSVYANRAPASVISRTYTARAEGSRRAASACRPDAAVKACCRPPTPFPFLDAEGFGIDIDIDIDIDIRLWF